MAKSYSSSAILKHLKAGTECACLAVFETCRFGWGAQPRGLKNPHSSPLLGNPYTVMASVNRASDPYCTSAEHVSDPQGAV